MSSSCSVARSEKCSDFGELQKLLGNDLSRGGEGGPFYVVWFRQTEKLHDFVLAEFDALLTMFGLDPKLVYNPAEFSRKVPVVKAKFDDEKVCAEICKRAMMIKGIFHVWGTGRDMASMAESIIEDDPNKMTEINKYTHPDQNWGIEMRAQGTRIKGSKRNNVIQFLETIGPKVEFKGKVELDTSKETTLFYIHVFKGDAGIQKKSDQIVSKKEKRRQEKRAEKQKLRETKKQKTDMENEIIENKKMKEARKPKENSTVENEQSDEKGSEGESLLEFCMFSRLVALPMHDYHDKYALKKRPFLGTTSLENELAFVMANIGLVKPGAMVLDPFAGTCSILVPCAVFGAQCMGIEIDFRVVVQGKDNQGNQDKKIEENFQQFNLPPPEVIFGDFSPKGNPLRHIPNGFLDAVICDPPYGIRERARKVGDKNGTAKKVKEEHLENHIPQLQPYGTADLMVDLVDSAARMLKLGGRLLYLLPVKNTANYHPSFVPQHQCLRLISNSVQLTQRPSSRRLIVMEKIAEYDMDKASSYRENTYSKLTIPSFQPDPASSVST